MGILRAFVHAGGRGIFLAGARVTFKLELKVTRGWKNGRHPVVVPCDTAKKRPITARELPGKAPFVKCEQGITDTLPVSWRVPAGVWVAYGVTCRANIEHFIFRF